MDVQTVGTIIVSVGTVIVAWVGWNALRVSQRVQADSALERARADARDRLIWMQTLLNAVPGVPDARAAQNREVYEDLQRWMLTALATAGLRDALPKATMLAIRPFDDPWAGMIELRDLARDELHRALEHESRSLVRVSPAAR